MNNLSSYSDLKKYGENILRDAGVSEFENDALLSILRVFNIDRAYLYLHMNDELCGKDKEIREYLDIIEKRKQRIPLQHIFGVCDFYGYEFNVNENVLIPRMDTEILVSRAIEAAGDIKDKREAGLHKKEPIRILDMCTGSGCIAISLYKELESMGYKVEVDAVDVSKEAIEVATSNANKNNAKISFILSDLFEYVNHDKYDIIVSNPPYIRTSDIEDLEIEVKKHDPLLALDGSEDGLMFYEKITDDAKEHMNDEGYLLYEIGYDQGEDVKKIMLKNDFKEIEIIKDLAGLDRVVVGRS